MLVYKRMDIAPGFADANAPTQFGIGTRYLHSLVLLAALDERIFVLVAACWLIYAALVDRARANEAAGRANSRPRLPRALLPGIDVPRRMPGVSLYPGRDAGPIAGTSGRDRSEVFAPIAAILPAAAPRERRFALREGRFAWSKE